MKKLFAICFLAMLSACGVAPKNHEVYFSGWVSEKNSEMYIRGKGVISLDFDAKHQILMVSLVDSSTSETLFYLDASSVDMPLSFSNVQHFRIPGQIFSPSIQDLHGLNYKADFYSSDAEWFFLNTPPSRDTSFFYYQGSFDNPDKWRKSMRQVVKQILKSSSSL